jgi:serine/threonine protein kinase/tetratricopeptide (TPR) repeat protein
MPLTLGSRLGAYEIVSLLGAGGMGEVYRAHDTRLGRDVALKVLPVDVASHADRLARFEREARTVAGLNHPNIVVLYSVEDADGVRFLTMELAEGQSLDKHVVPDGMPFARVLDLGIALADALTAAHEKGVVHRDLKPANVMVTREGRVKVLDFGLAKLTAEDSGLEGTQAATVAPPLSGAGQVMGTVPYMAPEQIRGGAVDARTDLFALGILLYELAAGRRPFTGATPADVSSAILRDTQEPLSRWRADIPGDVERIVARCLEKNPRARFQTALDVCNELRRAKQALETGTPAKPPATTVPSIAVLPFANMSSDEENEYFSDGLAEELMNMLAKIRGLRVAARTSSFHFKGKTPTIAEVGSALNVATVLEGSVRKSGNRVRISAQLVKVSDGYHLWSETFERTLDDVFAVQDEVARAVVAALPGELLSGQAGLAVSRGTQDRDAYDAYLEGRFFWNKRTELDVKKAIQFFERAIALDPAFAEAWVGVADCHVVLPFYSLTPASDALPRAREAALRALELKPDLGPAHATLAYALMVDLQWEQAAREFLTAIEQSPDDATAHKWYADLLMMTGRSSAAQRQIRRALELDPLSASIWTILGEWHWFEGQLDEAMAQYRKALELTPALPLALELAARLCWQRDDVEEYFRLRERPEAVSQRVAVPTRLLREAFAKDGRRGVLQAQLSAPIARQLPSDRARWHAELGDLDAAFRDLDDALAERELRLAYVTYFADFAPLWKDPRYESLLARMGVKRDSGHA